MTTFGTELRRARVAAGVTQAQLGEPQFSRSYVSLLESGARQPTADVLQHFAQKLGLSSQELHAWLASEAESSELVRVALQVEAVFRLAKVSRPDARQMAQGLAQLAATDDSLMGEMRSALNVLFIDDDATGEDRLQALNDLDRHRIVHSSAALYAEVLDRRCFTYRSTGRLAECVDAAREGVRVLNAMPNGRYWLVSALVPLVSALAELGRDDEAFREAEELALAADMSLRPSDEGVARWALGNLYMMRGETDEGIRQHDLAAECLNPDKYLRSWARLQRAAAGMRVLHGVALDTVPKLLDNAARAFSIASDSSDATELELVRVAYFIATQDWDRAVELAHDILPKAADVVAPQSLAELHERYGIALMHLERRDEGADQLRQAVVVFQSVGAYERALSLCSEWGIAPPRTSAASQSL